MSSQLNGKLAPREHTGWQQSEFFGLWILALYELCAVWNWSVWSSWLDCTSHS